MYAILNIKTKKFVYGSDWRYRPTRQRTSKEEALTFEWDFQARMEFLRRKCGKNYRIVKVNITVLSIVDGGHIE